MNRAVRPLAVAFLSWSLVFIGGTFAAEKPSSVPNAVRAGTEPTPKEHPRKARVDFYTGKIESLDARAGQVVVKRKKETRIFRVVDEKDRKQIEKYAPGDKVIIKHVDGVIQSIIKPGKNKPAAPPTNKTTPGPNGSAPPAPAVKKQ